MYEYKQKIHEQMEGYLRLHLGGLSDHMLLLVQVMCAAPSSSNPS